MIITIIILIITIIGFPFIVYLTDKMEQEENKIWCNTILNEIKKEQEKN